MLEDKLNIGAWCHGLGPGESEYRRDQHTCPRSIFTVRK